MTPPEIFDRRDLALRVLQDAPVLILVLDMGGKVEHVNPFCERLTGYRLDELRGKDWIDHIVPKRDHERIRALFEQSRSGKHVRGQANPIVTRTGEERQIEWADEFLLDDQGRPTGILAIGQDVTERKTAEEALRISEQRLAEAHRIASIGSWDVDVNTGAGWWSEEQYRMRGISPETPVTHDLFLETLHPDDRGMLEQGFQTTLAAGNWEGEYRIIRPDGQARVLYARAKRINDEHGKPIKLAGTNQDVTDRRAAEKKMAEQARLLDLIFQHSLDNIAILDKDYNFVRVSESYARGTQMNAAELVGRNHFELFPSSFEQELAPYRQAKQTYHKIERPFIYANHPEWGTTYWDLAMVPILDAAREIEFYLFTLKDVTDRKRAEDSLLRAEQRYRKLFEQSPHSVVIIDPEKATFLEFNDAACRHLGYTRDEFGRLSISDIDAVETPTETRERMQELLRVGTVTFETEHRTKQDERRDIIVIANVIELEGKKLIQSIYQDITERKRAEEAIRRSLAEKETLLREIHHRVKNNLQVVSGLLHFHGKKFRTPEDVAVFTELRQRIFAMTLVHERLYQSPDVARVDFADYLRGLVAELIRSFGPRKSIRLDVTSDDVRLPIEQALPTGMIVSELVSNVLKYAFPGTREGAATVSVRAVEGGIVLAVDDDGVGFPAGFDPRSGSSFGWELVRTLVLQLDGTLEASTDRGAHVRISFPAAPARVEGRSA